MLVFFILGNMTKKRKKYSKKRLAYLKTFALINIILLLLNIISYFFLTGPAVWRSQAQTFVISLTVGTTISPQCSDSLDNDSDGLIDYPMDPGCDSPSDDDETDPVIQPEEPSQPSQPSQGNYNPPTQPPAQEQELPAWLTIDQINNNYLTDLVAPYQFNQTILTFKGQTNLNQAIIFIQLNDQPNVIYTTYVGSAGYWEWVTPYNLNFAAYEIYVWGINPANPLYTAETRLGFEVLKEIISPPLPPPATTTPPVIPPGYPQEVPVIIYPEIVPKEIYYQAKEFYNLNLRVLNKDHQLYPKDKLDLLVDIYKLKPKEKTTVELKFIIRDADQKILSLSKKDVTIENSLSFIQTFSTSFNIKAGEYTVEAAIEKDNKIFTTSDFFIVKEKPIYFMGSEITLTQQGLAKYLLTSFLFLFLLLSVFCSLLIWDYWRSFADKHISEKDLEKDDYLDLK